MTEQTATDGASTTVEWRRMRRERVPSPIVRRLPYLELTLEHPDLEPTGHAGFFPDAVPYALEGVHRVFYWRPSLTASGPPSDWELACATPDDLVAVDALPVGGPPLVAEGPNGTTVVVDGTPGGDARTTTVGSYAPPEVRVDRATDAAVELTVAGTGRTIPAGERRRIRLAERTVESLDGGGTTTTMSELVVRYPGRRELHHPGEGATYRLFPSFGLDLDEVPNPLSIPTAAGELDDGALATALGVDLTERPYPERALWQAFAYTAFDPHGATTPALAQTETGHLLLRAGEST